MRVLHAYICNEYYGNWAKEQSVQCQPVTRDAFLRAFGTPMIVFDTQEREEFYPIFEGGLIRINPNYHIDCRPYRTVLPELQPSEQFATVIETALKSPTITSIRTRIFGWLGI
jgi:hypothetical protein